MPDIGGYSIRFALVIALLGLGSAIYAGATRRPEWTRVAERSVWIVFAFVSLSMIALFYAFATFDYQLLYVASHSARSMPLHYRLAALWGGQAGSLLLWLWMLMAYSAASVWFNRAKNRTLMPWVITVLLANAIFFLVLVAFVTAKNLWSISRLPIEFALLGWQLTVIRFGVTLILPPVLGFLAETLFGQRVERMREAVRL
ncbi:MAG: hypothetical protein JRE43_12695 [Deltaproteobacteria bacterium]|jgi:cytochrome c-type biogenesis protein CcmF|nr:hypothetical protein [Deltaproteobacteria bacterium]